MSGIKSDKWIKRMALEHEMIWPFEPKAVKEVQVKSDKGKIVAGGAPPLDLPPSMRGVVSFGVSSYGYDMRVADKFSIFKNVHCVEVDPKAIDERAFEEIQTDSFVRIPPNSFALARSVEKFKIPENVLCIVLGKSTYARCGVVCNVTPLEPGWEGYVTIEISNTTPLPARIYANEGIAQVLFFEADEPCELSYAAKNAGKAGKYQNQGPSVVLPRV